LGAKVGLKCRQLVQIIFLFFVTGCAYAPGLYMDNVELPDNEPTRQELFGVKYKVVPVTMDVINKMNSVIEYPPKDPPDVNRPYEYIIGEYDVLHITVWDHPELESSVAHEKPVAPGEPEGAKATGHFVDRDGNIFFPYAGVINVAGLTVGQAREGIIQKLSKLIPDPQLDVRVSAYRSKQAYVVGEVRKPGRLPIADVPRTIADAIAGKGGLTDSADLRNAVLNRNGKNYKIDLLKIYDEGDMTQNYVLREGDILRIPDNRMNRVYLMGEVARQRTMVIPNRKFSLADTIGVSQGFNLSTADTSRIFVFRRRANIPFIYHLNAKSAETLILATEFPMKPMDVVYVAPTKLARWNRFFRQILPSIQSLWYSTRIVREVQDIENDLNGDVSED